MAWSTGGPNNAGSGRTDGLHEHRRGGVLHHAHRDDVGRVVSHLAGVLVVRAAPVLAGLRSLSTSSRMVIAAACQPLAAKRPKIVSRAVSSSRWNGWGSNSAAKVLIRSSSIGSGPERTIWPTATSSRYRHLDAFLPERARASVAKRSGRTTRRSRLARPRVISRRAATRVALGIVPPRLAVPKRAPPGCP